MNGISLYTASKCTTATGTDLHKTSHASNDGEETLCGKDLTTGWFWITNNTFGGEVTCKECLKEYKRSVNNL